MPPPPRPSAPVRYQPYYCEENVWWLCSDPAFAAFARHVVFIANPARTCLLAEQRAGGGDGEVVWDYHVILMVHASDWWIYDLNSLLGMPVGAEIYLDRTFPPQVGLADRYAPSFRVIDAADFVSRFTSDRRHMRGPDGSWLHPPPRWAPPASDQPHNLGRFIDFTDEFAGEVLDLAQLYRGLNSDELSPTRWHQPGLRRE